MRLQTRVVDPGNILVGLEPLRQGECVFDVSLSADGDGLETLQEEPRVEWGHAWPEVAHGIHA